MLRRNKILSLIIVIGLMAVFSSCSKDEEDIVNYQDSHLFFGGMSVGMDIKEAEKASANSRWFEGILDNHARSVKRAKVSSAEFFYNKLPLLNGNSIIPRITFNDDEEVIMAGMNMILENVMNDSEFERTLESYKKDFLRICAIEELEEVVSDTPDVKQIGEKSIFRTSTKLFYDAGIKNCHYWFDKSTKTGYVMYEIDRTGEATLAKYELAFLQFKY